MTQEQNSQEFRHEQFLKKVVESGSVWGLKNPQGWATSSSSDYEDIDVLPFWSDKAHASTCRKEEWQDYEEDMIPLGEFIEDWCVGMHNDNVLVGTDWDENLSGMEIEPLELAFQLLTALKKNGKTADLKKYTPEELEGQILEVISADEAEEED